MEFIRTIREKSQTRKQETLQQQAEDYIRLSDFDNSLYISFNGVPLVPIEKSWTTEEIIQELSVLRQNFVNCKMKRTTINLEL